MEKRKIFITRPLPSIAGKLLQEHFHVTENKNNFLSQEELIDIVQHYDGVLSTVADSFTQDILQKKQKLEVISNYAIGVDNIDIKTAKNQHIAIYNLPDVVTNSSADHTMAIFLALIRKICPASRYVKDNKWKYWQYDLFLGEELFDKNFGIIGMGRIGEAVAKRAASFGMHIYFYNRTKKQMPSDMQNFQQVTLDELFSVADYLSLHVALSEQTKHLIDAAAIAKMKKNPVIINMARGAIVKLDDLYQALKEKKIRAAAMDVTEPEPLSGDHPICALENCLITPHIGTSTQECRFIMAKKAAENIIKHFAL